ncbi:uncharacterized protein LOC128392059 [Panonychus citri]|uniref:uncharacterized protein LOC128389797 n=1 Tax=Panonychus citri TaxID=50023 RepID=UPI0023082B62|nr:uncharacterized protein LOC128389797 [Panonychus citri]XP_053208017.1 uncharacterized protein LOC128392059 [Panonychus citri]
MTDSYDSIVSDAAEFCSKLENVRENLLPPKFLSKSKNTMQHEIEQKMRDEVKTLKSLRDECTKLEKEIKVKQDSVSQYSKSYEQLENRIVRSTEKYEEKVKQEQARKALISSVFNFLGNVGLDFQVINLENESPDSYIGTYKVSLSQVDPVDPDKFYSITFKSSLVEINILETDFKDLEEEFKKIEEFINSNLKSGQINLIGFLVRVRKLIINRLQS